MYYVNADLDGTGEFTLLEEAYLVLAGGYRDMRGRRQSLPVRQLHDEPSAFPRVYQQLSLPRLDGQHSVDHPVEDVRGDAQRRPRS